MFTFYQFFWAVLSIRCYLYSLLTACDVLGAPPTQRCLSDPGSDSITSIHDQDVKAHILGEYDSILIYNKSFCTFKSQKLCVCFFKPGETEFNQRLERFKVPVFEPSPTQNSASCSRTRSNFVSDIHQKLQGDTTPSSKQASRMRQVGKIIVQVHLYRDIKNPKDKVKSFLLFYLLSLGTGAGIEQVAIPTNQWERLAEEEQFWFLSDAGGLRFIFLPHPVLVLDFLKSLYNFFFFLY